MKLTKTDGQTVLLNPSTVVAAVPSPLAKTTFVLACHSEKAMEVYETLEQVELEWRESQLQG